jgi:aldose 1-epimerase
MSFSIRHWQENGLDLLGIREAATGTEVAIIPGHGSTLHTFRVRDRSQEYFNVIDHYRDLTDLQKEMGTTFKGPKLSPFPCRIRAGKYRLNGKAYQFDHLFNDGTAIHGLLFNKAFAVTGEEADELSGTVFLSYTYDREDKGYPFHYSCQIKYCLHPDGVLEVLTTVTNLDDKPIPIADGWHPYFRLGGRVDDWELQFHADAIVEFDEELIPTGHLAQYVLFDQSRSIGDLSLDNCFALKPGLVSPACEIYNPANGCRISFLPDPNYPYLQIYTPRSRDSIAVENLSGAPDCFNNKMGLTMLAPGHSQIFTVRYKVSFV